MPVSPSLIHRSSVIDSPHESLSSIPRTRPGAARPPPPARIVPVPAQFRSLGPFRPHHDVRDARQDLLVAAGAPVGLGGRGPRDLPHHPVPVRPGLYLLRSEPDRCRILRAGRGRIGPPGAPARSAPDLVGKAACLARAHGGQRMAPTHYSWLPCGSSSPGAAWTTQAGSRLIFRSPPGC